MLPAPPGPDDSIPFLYKAAAYANPDGTTEVASVGEDGGALVWRGQARVCMYVCIQWGEIMCVYTRSHTHITRQQWLNK
jgi:hypothetical protein